MVGIKQVSFQTLPSFGLTLKSVLTKHCIASSGMQYNFEGSPELS